MFEDLLNANEQYARTFSLAGLEPAAAKHFALVTCIDSRIEPLAALGLRPGDAKILRNAGGRVTDDVLRSLVTAVALLGVRRIAVMHHTACALAGRSDAQIRSTIRAATGTDLGQMWLGAMPDPGAALAADVEAIRACQNIPSGVAVAGWRYDVQTGEVTQVVT